MFKPWFGCVSDDVGGLFRDSEKVSRLVEDILSEGWATGGQGTTDKVDDSGGGCLLFRCCLKILAVVATNSHFSQGCLIPS